MECTACPQDRMSAFDTHHRQNSCCLPAAHLLVSLFMLVASRAAVSGPDGPAVPVLDAPETSRVEMTIGQAGFTVTLADTPAARALGAHLPLLIDMAELNGNEKHAALPQPLPVSASRRVASWKASRIVSWGRRAPDATGAVREVNSLTMAD